MKLIDADAIKWQMFLQDGEWRKYCAKEQIDSMPEVLVEYHHELIRCKDCYYWRKGVNWPECYCILDGGYLPEDHYCSRAKRKEDYD